MIRFLERNYFSLFFSGLVVWALYAYLFSPVIAYQKFRVARTLEYNMEYLPERGCWDVTLTALGGERVYHDGEACPGDVIANIYGKEIKMSEKS